MYIDRYAYGIWLKAITIIGRDDRISLSANRKVKDKNNNNNGRRRRRETKTEHRMKTIS